MGCWWMLNWPLCPSTASIACQSQHCYIHLLGDDGCLSFVAEKGFHKQLTKMPKDLLRTTMGCWWMLNWPLCPSTASIACQSQHCYIHLLGDDGCLSFVAEKGFHKQLTKMPKAIYARPVALPNTSPFTCLPACLRTQWQQFYLLFLRLPYVPGWSSYLQLRRWGATCFVGLIAVLSPDDNIHKLETVLPLVRYAPPPQRCMAISDNDSAWE